MTQIASLEFVDAKIRVNAVCPTAIQTEMITTFLETAPDRAQAEAVIASVNPMVGQGVNSITSGS